MDSEPSLPTIMANTPIRYAMPMAMLTALQRGINQLLCMFKKYWDGGNVRRNCLTHALHRLVPYYLTTRDVVIGAAMARRADLIGGESQWVLSRAYTSMSRAGGV